ncbi:hypothetical protein BS47DRAFT_1363251 [Hydnum rufescens UP504]|uniref:Ribonuclease H1 N-terminal domain-containing protein n=1 Tax=Hydnum rufescens UP504 TaxID=1448309 RepID=A0A9P6DW03_9AGAM|nr:hypothetical protein BS47DRAFT_1363251 [Hydnum rufescens UP504]
MNQSLKAVLPSLHPLSALPPNVAVVPEVPAKTATESSEVSGDDPSAIAPASQLSAKPEDMESLVSAAASLSLSRSVPTATGDVTSVIASLPIFPQPLHHDSVIHPVSPDPGTEAHMGRHWYLITKGLQMGVFQSWEATSPLVTGVSHAVYYHVPNAASGWIRYGNALQAGHVETITP